MNRGFRLPRAKPGAQIEDLRHGPLPRLGEDALAKIAQVGEDIHGQLETFLRSVGRN
jgi:hypothetical protein